MWHVIYYIMILCAMITIIVNYCDASQPVSQPVKKLIKYSAYFA